MAKRSRRPRRKLQLRRTLFLLPNLITLSSVFCGFYAMVLSSRATSNDEFRRAALLIVFAMVFDVLDGRVARMTKTESAFGLQIDSLADVVSFGAAPALLLHHWSLGRLGLVGTLACFVFVACGAIRLARFNVLSTDPGGAPTPPGKYIIGLPIPGAAAIVVALIVTDHAAGGALAAGRLPGLVIAVVVASAALMVSNVRFRSFKELRLDWRTVAVATFALTSSVLISIQLQPVFVLVWLLGIYVMLGIFESMWQISRRLSGRASSIEAPTGSPTVSTDE
jgi:CDP-diacylglycerol---serine O-phosphatidyltransferase